MSFTVAIELALTFHFTCVHIHRVQNPVDGIAILYKNSKIFHTGNAKWKNKSGWKLDTMYMGMTQSLVSHNQLSCSTGIGCHIYILQSVEMFEISLSQQLDMWGSVEQIWNRLKKLEPKWLKPFLENGSTLELFCKMLPLWRGLTAK